MQGSTNNHFLAKNPGFADMMIFSIRLLLGKRLYLIITLLIAVLLSGHLTMPMDLTSYDEGKQKEAQDISGIAGAVLEGYETVKEAIKGTPNAKQHQALQESLAFWSQLHRQSNAITQNYSAMQKFNLERTAQLDENWHKLYASVLDGLRKGLVEEDSDIILRIGQARLLEDSIYNNARKAMGLKPLEMRPDYSRGQFWRNLLSGSHYLSIAPLMALMLLLHNSFSIDHESGSAKLINSLPVNCLKRNAARLVAQCLLAIGLVAACVFLCSLTYPTGSKDHFLWRQGRLLSLDAYLSQTIVYTDYLQPAASYFWQAGGIYSLAMLFMSLLSMLLSARIRNSVIALLVPITLLLMLFMPNYMQTSLGKLSPPFTAIISPQMVIEDKAMLPVLDLCLLYLLGGFIFTLGIVLTGCRRRGPHVD